MRANEFITEKWTKKYKKSINCSNPKGFSQKAHCAGRKARQAGKKTKSSSISEEPIKLSGKSDKAKKFIEKVYDMFPQTFQNNHVMAWGEGDDMEFVMFELEPGFSKRDSVQVKWIQAYPLRRGVGGKAMKVLQDLAREDDITLTLYPWDKGQVSQSNLIKFYKKHGFKPVSKGAKNMIWEPK